MTAAASHPDGSPIRRGRHVTLRPVHPDDYGPLYETALFTDAGSLWRLHGDVPTQERFLQVLLNDARATFAIEANADRRLLGMVQLWMYDATSRNGHITAFLHPAARGRGWPLEGMILFVEYVFAAFDLHKLYFESLDEQYDQYRSLVGPILRHEGLLREHKRLFGRWADFHMLALFADDVPKLARLLRPASEASEPGAHERSEAPGDVTIEVEGMPA